MKYITFLVRIMIKPTKSYYELKKYISKEKKSLSFYFRLISYVLSERIETSIEYAQKMHAQSSSVLSPDGRGFEDSVKEELNVRSVIESDNRKK